MTRVRGAATRPLPGFLLLGLLLLGFLLPLVPGPVAHPRPVTAAVVTGPDWQWPLAGQPAVTRRFDPPPQRWLPGHRGVDLAGTPSAVVYAAGSGTVSFAGPVAGTPVVAIDHRGGLRTTYQPVTPVVAAGASVGAGDPIGLLDAGHRGCPVAACLHWGVRRGAVYLDPLALLGLGRVRLLPLPPAPILQ